MTDLRIRLDLSDFVHGMNAKRWMHLSGDKVSLVADIVDIIRGEYEEVEDDDCVNLFLDGFSLLSWEPVKILKNGDLVKGFLLKGKTKKRQLSEADNERCSPKKRKKLDANIKKVSVSDKIKPQNASASKNVSPESKLKKVKEMAKKKETSSSSSSSSSSEDGGNIKIPPKKEIAKVQEVIKNIPKKDSSTSSSSSSSSEDEKVAVKKVNTVATKIPVAVLLKKGTVSSSSDDSSSSSSSEDDEPTKQKTTKNYPPIKAATTQNKDNSSSSDSESEEPKVTEAPKNGEKNKTGDAPTKPKRVRKRKNKNKNKLPITHPPTHTAPPPMRWQNSKSNAPQNNRIIFDDPETYTAEQIQELYKMSKPVKNLSSPRPDLLPKINGLENGPEKAINGPEKAVIGPSLGICEAALLSSQAEKANPNNRKQTPRIVFRPSVVSFNNGTSASESKTESSESSRINGFSSLLNGRGALYSRSEKSAKQQQLNDVQTNVSEVLTNPVTRDVAHKEKDSGEMQNEEIIKDYSVYHPVSEGGPRQGDIIAYKMVEISDNYTPELSEYKEGKVVDWDGKKKVTLELINKQIKKREGRFEVEGMTDDVGVGFVKEFSWDELIEPRLIFP